MIFENKSIPFLPCGKDYISPKNHCFTKKCDVIRKEKNGNKIFVCKKGRRVFLESDTYNNLFPLDIPIQVDFELTHKCNLNCRHCYLKQKNEGFSEKTWIALKKMLDSGVMIIELSGGEPFLVKDIFKIIEYIKKRGKIVTIATNATLVTNKIARNLSRNRPYLIYVSLDGSKEIHDKIRGEGNFKRALEGIANLNRYKIKPLISVTVNKFNINSIPKLVKELKDLDIAGLFIIPLEPNTNDENFKRYCFTYEELKDLNKKISAMNLNVQRIIMPSAHCSLEDVLYFGCFFKLTMCQVTPSGNVLDCPILRTKHGNLIDENLQDIWKKMYKNLINSKGRKCLKCEWNKRCFPCRLLIN